MSSRPAMGMKHGSYAGKVPWIRGVPIWCSEPLLEAAWERVQDYECWRFFRDEHAGSALGKADIKLRVKVRSGQAEQTGQKRVLQASR
jgi:hypothetical protein